MSIFDALRFRLLPSTGRIDQSAMGNHGVYAGGVAVVDDKFVFDGLDDEITIPGSEAWLANKWSIFVFCETRDIAEDLILGIVTKNNLTINHGIGIFQNSTTVGDETSQFATVASDTLFSVGMVYDGEILTCYVDGEIVGDPLTADLIETDDIIRIGRWYADGVESHYFEGDIYEVCIWHRDLSTTEMLTMHNGGVPGYSYSPLLAPVAGGSDDLYTDFLLNSASSIVKFETLEISHPSFLNKHYVVRNNTVGLTAKIETGQDIFFDYLPMRITENSAQGDLDYALTIEYGDLGENLPVELDRIFQDSSLFVEPTVIYRSYRSDNLSVPMQGPIELKIKTFSFNQEGSTFEARADRGNSQKTGELYTLDRFPMMRAFL